MKPKGTKMQTSESITDLSAAMAAAQGEMKPAVKDATNPHFKSKYADLSSVFEAIRTPFAKHGLSVWQELGNAQGGVTVLTRVVHKSGQWVEFGPLFVPAMKQDAQGLGSAATYARRYGLASALGVCADEDDDGNGAVKSGPANGNADAFKAGGATTERKMSKPAARAEYDKLLKEMQACSTVDELAHWGGLNKPRLDAMPDDWQQALRDEYSGHKATLMERAA